MKKHFLSAAGGTCICALSMLFFMLNRSKLPQQIEVYSLGTNISTSAPVMIYAVPVMFIIMNLYANLHIHSHPQCLWGSRMLQEIFKWILPVFMVFMQFSLLGGYIFG